ncbi:alanine dehydrogenase [Listeria costaricensis]|uniref:alanine dehydrogenase n=1 Tax=Listeria costaricensis TaxID=2026604 RepID=UPI000C068828|nr:alanine dehydrogenase [Listeria costaricensis]
MRIGVVKEIKNNENRVGLTPYGAKELVAHGHEVLVEKNAGAGSGFHDEEYLSFGAKIIDSAADVWQADMVIKVKEPLKEEYPYFRKGLILFTYLHLAAEKELTEALVEKEVTAIAYETIQLPDRSLPLLTPMSQIAGRMASQVGAHFLEKVSGKKGILLSGVPGVERGIVTVVGGGVAGINAARIAIGLGAKVNILDINPLRLQEIENIFGNEINTLMSNAYNIEKAVTEADLVIGAVLIPGAKAPKLVSEAMVKKMKPGSVLVDIAIDQGGIFETTDRITTHDNPTYEKHGVIHYAVANMPGAVPNTSTLALTNCTLPYAVMLADKGYRDACLANELLLKGMNTYAGFVTCEPVADAFGMPHKDFKSLIN